MNAPGTTTRRGHEAERWLMDLAPLVLPLFPAAAGEALQPYLPLLENVPAEAFNRETLEAAARCARGSHGVPTYAELRAVLAAWCREHRAARASHEKVRDTVPEGERCTPEQAAEILRRHGWAPPKPEPKPVRANYVTGEQLAEARRRAGIRVPETRA